MYVSEDADSTTVISILELRNAALLLMDQCCIVLLPGAAKQPLQSGFLPRSMHLYGFINKFLHLIWSTSQLRRRLAGRAVLDGAVEKIAPEAPATALPSNGQKNSKMVTYYISNPKASIFLISASKFHGRPSTFQNTDILQGGLHLTATNTA